MRERVLGPTSQPADPEHTSRPPHPTHPRTARERRPAEGWGWAGEATVPGAPRSPLPGSALWAPGSWAVAAAKVAQELRSAPHPLPRPSPASGSDLPRRGLPLPPRPHVPLLASRLGHWEVGFWPLALPFLSGPSRVCPQDALPPTPGCLSPPRLVPRLGLAVTSRQPTPPAATCPPTPSPRGPPYWEVRSSGVLGDRSAQQLCYISGETEARDG